MPKVSKEQREAELNEVLRWAVRRRWVLSSIYALLIGGSMEQIISKRAQLPLLFAYPPALGVPVLGDISTCLIFSIAVGELWLRVNNYRREQLAAEQEAFRKAAPPVEGSWPPPPVL